MRFVLSLKSIADVTTKAAISYRSFKDPECLFCQVLNPRPPVCWSDSDPLSNLTVALLKLIHFEERLRILPLKMDNLFELMWTVNLTVREKLLI